MSEKKKHHIIPVVYQNSFTDRLQSPETEPFVWRLDKYLLENPVRKAPSNNLYKNKFYKLATDTSQYHSIEELLNKIDTQFGQIVKKLETKAFLTEKDWQYLLLFVETMLYRSESHISHWQNQFDKVESIYRQVDQSRNNNQNYSDEFWEGSSEIGKRLVALGIATVSKMISEAGVYILLNKSEFALITSDNPVYWKLVHIDELELLQLPKAWTGDEHFPSEKVFFCYCPITPEIALFSSSLFNAEFRNTYWESDRAELIIRLNFLQHLTAESVVISNSPEPHGIFKSAIQEQIKSALSPDKGQKILFYTKTSRFSLKIDSYEWDGDFPKITLKIWTDDYQMVRKIEAEGEIEVLHIYVDGQERGMSRKMKFADVSDSSKHPFLLVQMQP